MKWVDESAYICARLDYPGKSFVTAGMEKVSYKKRVELGSIIRLNVEKEKAGNTSVTYEVLASVINTSGDECAEIFSTMVTFVSIDKDGNKSLL